MEFSTLRGLFTKNKKRKKPMHVAAPGWAPLLMTSSTAPWTISHHGSLLQLIFDGDMVVLSLELSRSIKNFE